jgi:hypothetical protein
VTKYTVPSGALLVLPAFGLARQAVDRWLKTRHVTPNVYSEVTGNEAILSLVSTGCGVGVVFWRFLRQDSTERRRQPM